MLSPFRAIGQSPFCGLGPAATNTLTLTSGVVTHLESVKKVSLSPFGVIRSTVARLESRPSVRIIALSMVSLTSGGGGRVAPLVDGLGEAPAKVFGLIDPSCPPKDHAVA